MAYHISTQVLQKTQLVQIFCKQPNSVEYNAKTSSSTVSPVKAIFDELVILCDCVDYGAKQRQAGGYDGAIVLEDKLDSIFL